MEAALAIYGGMVWITFIFIIQRAYPENWRQWGAAVGLSVFWPPFVLWAFTVEPARNWRGD